MVMVAILLTAFSNLTTSEPLITSDDCEDNCSKLKEDLGDQFGCSSICEATELSGCQENCRTEAEKAHVTEESVRGACGILCNRFDGQTTPESNTSE